MLTDIKSVQTLGEYMIGKIGQVPQESCWVIGVNTQMRVLCEVLVAVGTADSVMVHPRDVFRPLIAVNAYGFVLIHNHPSGHLALSMADQKMCAQLAAGGGLLQCHFLDFMVVSRHGYLSERTQHRLPKFSTEKLLEIWTALARM
jgi:DNA repair protein RadC